MILLASKPGLPTNILRQQLDKKNVWYTLVQEHHLLEDFAKTGKYDYVVFFHWSWKVPTKIYKKYKCVSVHTSNLPEGRGGTPIQNQILDGILESRINLLKTTDPIDSGDIYLSRNCTLQGSLTDIWLTIANTTAELIYELLTKEIEPVPQKDPQGKKYNRIKDNQIIQHKDDIHAIYDQIRMVDMDGYPKAYIDMPGLIIEFSRAKLLANGSILCDAHIRIPL